MRRWQTKYWLPEGRCGLECRVERGRRELFEGTGNILYLDVKDGYRKREGRLRGGCAYVVKFTQAASLKVCTFTQFTLCIYYIAKKINSNIHCYKKIEAIFLKPFTFKWLRPDVSMFNTCVCLK